MFIVADSGSTKCDWTIINPDNSIKGSFQTKGINPLILSKERITEILKSSIQLMEIKDLVTQIFFYGAGCENRQGNENMNTVLKEVFRDAIRINIKGDIEGAVAAVTSSPGVVCILGTGSNCCFYDGKNIIQKSPSLGYLIGDEGSGNAIGRELLKDYYLKRMPINLRGKFEINFETNLDIVLSELYQHSYPNRYLATYARFAINNKESDYIKKLIMKHIRNFFNTNFPYYKQDLVNCPVHFVGSIAYYSQDFIREILLELGLKPGNFIKSPIANLIRTIF